MIVMDNRLGPDLLSDLPLGIIENILIRVPIRDAVRTSILSSKWRYRWVSLPHLVFDMGKLISSLQNKVDEMFIQDFITQTLSRHEGPIHTFKLEASYWPHSYLVVDKLVLLLSRKYIKEWLLLLSKKDIKELILDVYIDVAVYVPVLSCLYSCRNLTVLELYGCGFGPPPPAFKGFPCLRSLILVNVNPDSGAIESLIANSPLLENLKCSCVGYFELRISAPNLKYFCIEESYEEIFLSAPLLAKMTVTLDTENEQFRHWNWQKDSGCNYTKFLGGVTNLESLTGNEIFTEYLSNGIQYCDHPLVFHHLKIITLSGVNFKNTNEILVVVRLIMDAVNLSELQFTVDSSFSFEGDGLKAPDTNFWNSEFPQNCTFKKLKVITMTSYSSDLHELNFIKFLLQSSPVLETMIIEPRYCTKKLDLAVELLTYSRASTSAKILFKNDRKRTLRR